MSTLARVLLLPLSGVAAILTAKIVSSDTGPDGYGFFTLVATLPLLFPFLDFGLGARLTNLAARLGENSSADSEFAESLRKTRRILLKSTTVITLVVLIIAALNMWPVILGLGFRNDLNYAIAFSLMTFALSVPATLGSRILVGLRKNVVVTIVQTLTSVVTLLLVLICSLLGFPPSMYVAFSTIGAATAAWSTYLIAMQNPLVKHAMSSSPTIILPENSLRESAFPMFVLSVSLPMMFQSERIVVAHFGGQAELGLYAFATLLYLPALSVVQVANRSFWGEFSSTFKTANDTLRRFHGALAISAALGLVIGAVYFVIVGPVSTWVSNAAVEIPLSLKIILSLSIFANSLHLPSGMYLTSSSGLKFQAVTSIVALVVGIPTSIFLTFQLGAEGPPLASLLVVALVQFLPTYGRVRKSLVEASMQ